MNDLGKKYALLKSHYDGLGKMISEVIGETRFDVETKKRARVEWLEQKAREIEGSLYPTTERLMEINNEVAALFEKKNDLEKQMTDMEVKLSAMKLHNLPSWIKSILNRIYKTNL